jgi:hypothetical protein
VKIVVSLTVTDLDAFRRYREEEEMTLEELLRRLRREEGPSDVMRAGSALHSVLEKPDEVTESMIAVERDGHRFIFAGDCNVAILPYRELYGKKTYRVDGQEIELRGKADAFSGLVVEDHKFTTSQFDAERYFSKYQWRAYLSLFGADTFNYNVFVSHFLGTDDNGVMEWEVREYHRLTLYRYPRLEADICRELGHYAEFAQRHLIAPRSAA